MRKSLLLLALLALFATASFATSIPTAPPLTVVTASFVGYGVPTSIT